MEFLFKEKQHQTPIIYGETVASFIKNNPLLENALLFITNQKYYDLFAEKMTQLFRQDAEIDWYICNNSRHCNDFSELENLIAFEATLSTRKESLLIGLGNEGIMQLSSFFACTSIHARRFWHFPLSMNALSQALTSLATIEWQNTPMLQCSGLSERIIFDHTLLNEKNDAKLLDFFIFLKCGIVNDYEFLQTLYKNFDTKKKFQQTSFTGLLEPFFRAYQVHGKEIQSFGRLFEQAFVHVANGHLLSEAMKQFLGCLLQLLWSQQVSQFSFHFKNFLIWLMKLGFPIDFPKEIFMSDYVDCLLQLFEKEEKALILSAPGKLLAYQKATALDLIKTIETYQEILKEIRG